MSFQDSKLPGFILGWAVVDLVFCSLRLIQLPISLFAVFFATDDRMQTMTVIETATLLPMVLVGIPAAVMILCKKRAGLTAGYICAALTAVSMLASVTNLLMLAPWDGEIPVIFGFFFGGAITFLLRIALLVIYCLMLLKFRDFLDSREEAAEEYPAP